MTFDDYREIWMVDWSADRPPGYRQRPTRLAARELRSRRSCCLARGELGRRPPFPLGTDSLYVAYAAPAALGCHLDLGWPMPERVLDLHAEFRCRVAGLDDAPAGDTLGKALDYSGLC